MRSLLHMASKSLPPLLIYLFFPYVLALPLDNGASGLSAGSALLASCSVDIAGQSFNLCPLLDHEVYATAIEVVGAAPSSSTASSPSPSVAVPANIEDDAGLRPGPRALRFTLRSGAGSPWRSTKDQKSPLAELGIRDVDGLWDAKSRALNMVLLPRGDRTSTASISFTCDTSFPGLGSLVYSRKEGRYAFHWRTQYACPTSMGRTSREDERIWIAEEDVPTPDDESEAPEGELVPHRPTWRTSRQWIAGFIGVVGFAVIFALVLGSSPRARFVVLQKCHFLLSAMFAAGARVAEVAIPLKAALASMFPASFHLPFTFRQGDNRLVQWAEEDMGLEEDFVNGPSAYESQLDGEEWNGNNLDEYIPLNLSPKWGRKAKSYGATPVRETFSEYLRR